MKLTVPIDEVRLAGARLLAITVPTGSIWVTDSTGTARARRGTSCDRA